MKRRARILRQVTLAVRVQRLTREVEALVPEVQAALCADGASRGLLSSAVRSLSRAATAVRALAEGRDARVEAGGFAALLAGTSPLLSVVGSRVVLAAGGRPKAPSVAAQALAVLLEDPDRSVGASDLAERLGCSVAVARTTLHRLVQGGHAARTGPGRFRAKAR